MSFFKPIHPGSRLRCCRFSETASGGNFAGIELDFGAAPVANSVAFAIRWLELTATQAVYVHQAFGTTVLDASSTELVGGFRYPSVAYTPIVRLMIGESTTLPGDAFSFRVDGPVIYRDLPFLISSDIATARLAFVSSTADSNLSGSIVYEEIPL